MRTEFLCISVLRVASGPRVKLASCKSALNPPVGCSTDRSKAVVPVLVLLFCCFVVYSTRRFLYVFPCVILFLCFSVLLLLRLPRFGKRELILVFFVRLFGLCLFGFVGFLFLLGSLGREWGGGGGGGERGGGGCGLWLWHSLNFSLTFFDCGAAAFSASFFPFGVLERKVIGNCIDSWSLPSFLFDISCKSWQLAWNA